MATKKQKQVPQPTNEADKKGVVTWHDPNDVIGQDFVAKESGTKKNAKGQKVWIVLFPRSFGKPKKFKTVELRCNGKVISKLKFVYYEIEHGTPYRQVWKSDIVPKDLPLNCTLVADDHGWFLKNPKVRID